MADEHKEEKQEQTAPGKKRVKRVHEETWTEDLDHGHKSHGGGVLDGLAKISTPNLIVLAVVLGVAVVAMGVITYAAWNVATGPTITATAECPGETKVVTLSTQWTPINPHGKCYVVYSDGNVQGSDGGKTQPYFLKDGQGRRPRWVRANHAQRFTYSLCPTSLTAPLNWNCSPLRTAQR